MTKMLDLIESYLEQSGHKPCRIDGSMPFEVRCRPAAVLHVHTSSRYVAVRVCLVVVHCTAHLALLAQLGLRLALHSGTVKIEG
jgi:hypothetical protein